MRKIFNNLPTLSSILVKTYLFSIGLLWIAFHIYIRLFIIRYAYKLTELGPNLTFQYFLLSALFLCGHFMILTLIVYNLFKKRTKQEYFLITQLRYLVDLLYWNPLLFWHDLLAPNIPYSGEFLYNFGKYLWRQTKLTHQAITICFNFLPRIIVAYAFFIDIVFFNEIHYFIYAVHLVIIPILYNLFMKLFSSFILRCLLDIEEVIKVTPGEEKDQYHFELQKDYSGYDSAFLQEQVEVWIWFKQMYNDYVWFNTFQDCHTKYVILFTSSLYLSAGLYKLYLISTVKLISDIFF